MEPYFVYIVRCADGTLYTGTAKDLQSRERAHNEGRGARYTAGRRPVTMVYAESCESRSLALKREHQVKRLTRAQKESLVGGQIDFLQAVRSGNKD
jgi:putative endonuclease